LDERKEGKPRITGPLKIRSRKKLRGRWKNDMGKGRLEVKDW
jgi:hypothetical protein